jgi:hypothetical protein
MTLSLYILKPVDLYLFLVSIFKVHNLINIVMLLTRRNFVYKKTYWIKHAEKALGHKH